MKLILAIVNNDDSARASSALTDAGFSVTRLSTTGGFLMVGNTTFLICVEDDQVDEVIGVVQRKCHHRKQFVPSTPTYGTGSVGEINSVPLEVAVGGATIFVTNIERFEKL